MCHSSTSIVPNKDRTARRGDVVKGTDGEREVVGKGSIQSFELIYNKFGRGLE